MPTAIIFGASGDIGSAISKELAKKGYSLYLHSHRHSEKVLKIREEFSGNYPSQDFFVVSLDMRDVTKIDSFLENIFQVDALIFAQGDTHYSLLRELPQKRLEELWQVHLYSPMLLCQKLENRLAQSNHGRIIFISSVYGLNGSAMEVAYSTMKSGQIGFVKSYAKEIASRGITINALAAGAVDTKLNKDFTVEDKKRVCENIPVGRFAKPEEIAYLTTYLLDDVSDYITGTTITIDGGWT
ncbi:MAG: SDR family oxidoreductase [Streptococcaceae bacterium]|jgi:3-oxoacyl-[acyl-carrier protein] reductase|nr:SDR family oxidoreductase [Streptococcaceae bacterium]